MAEPVVLNHVAHRREVAPAVRSGEMRARTRPKLDEVFARYVTQPTARLLPVIITLAVFASLVAGWSHRDEGHLTPESGTGYWLGITGASAMLLLLVYPMRKRMPSLRFLGSVPFWFRLHMLLGILGPLLIVFHSNFQLGALNSNVAFVSMLIVAASGVIGRYIYGKIHLGLSGRKAAVRQILDDAEQLQGTLGRDLPGGAEIMEQMTLFANAAMAPRRSAASSLIAMLGLGLRSHLLRHRLVGSVRSALVAEARTQGWSRHERRAREADFRTLLRVYLAAVNKAAKFGLFERLFALWHVLHLPLFFLLIAAALVHVFAVHFY